MRFTEGNYDERCSMHLWWPLSSMNVRHGLYRVGTSRHPIDVSEKRGRCDQAENSKEWIFE